MYCRYCAFSLPEDSEICPNCGKPVTERPVERPRKKSRTVAGVLALTLGIFGAHNFYIGHKPKAVTQLVMSTVGGILSCGVSTVVIGVWALAEAVGFFTGKKEI